MKQVLRLVKGPLWCNSALYSTHPKGTEDKLSPKCGLIAMCLLEKSSPTKGKPTGWHPFAFILLYLLASGKVYVMTSLHLLNYFSLYPFYLPSGFRDLSSDQRR